MPTSQVFRDDGIGPSGDVWISGGVEEATGDRSDTQRYEIPGRRANAADFSRHGPMTERHVRIGKRRDSLELTQSGEIVEDRE